jgi:hypothetical protein
VPFVYASCTSVSADAALNAETGFLFLQENDMSETKFTPAPWAVVFNCIGEPVVVKQRKYQKHNEWLPCDSDAGIVGDIGDHTDTETASNKEANAQLIAAAPELYAELESIRNYIQGNRAIEFKNRIDKLLTKARGE